MRGIWIVLALVLIPLPAWSQTRDQNLTKCGSSDPDTSINGCSALIQSGQETKTVLAAAYQNRGNAYLAKDFNDQATADYTQAIALQPDNGVLYILRGIAYDHNDHQDQGIADYSKAIALKLALPDLAFAYSNRGYDYEDKSLNDQAIADYRAALKADPKDGSAQDGLKRLGATP